MHVAGVVDQMAGQDMRGQKPKDLMQFRRALNSQVGGDLPAELSRPLNDRENFLYENDWRFMQFIRDDVEAAPW